MGESGAGDDELAGRISALYELDPDEFVAAREAQAKALRAEKRRDDANLIHGLAKPTVVAWAASRAAVAQPKLLDRLVDAGSALVDAQRRAIEDGDASALRPAQAERRAAVIALVDAAEAVLERRERSGAVRRDELSALFDAVSLDPDAAAELRTGRLARPPDAAPAFDPFSAAAVPAAARAARPAPARGRKAGETSEGNGRRGSGRSTTSRTKRGAGTEATDTDADVDDAAAERQAAEERQRAEDLVAKAQAAHAEAVREAEEAHHRQERAAAVLAAANEAVADLDAQLARAREERERASDEAEQAVSEASTADELVGQASAALEEAEQARRTLG